MTTEFRDFTNKPGTTYDADRTSTVFAEDLNLISTAVNALEDAAPPLPFYFCAVSSDEETSISPYSDSAITIDSLIAAAPSWEILTHGVFRPLGEDVGGTYKFEFSFAVSGDFIGPIVFEIRKSGGVVNTHPFYLSDFTVVQTFSGMSFLTIESGDEVSITINNDNDGTLTVYDRSYSSGAIVTRLNNEF